MKKENYCSIYQSFSAHLEIIRHLNRIFPILHSQYLTAEYKKLHNLMDRYPGSSLESLMLQSNESYDPSDMDILKASPTSKRILRKGSKLALHNLGAELFLREMSLVYLVTSFEDFLKKILVSYYRTYPESLKSSQTLTVEEILNKKSMDKLLDKIIEDKTVQILRGDIVEINKNISKIMDYSSEKEWKEFCERFYRRNVIVHNDGKPDETYYRKTSKRRTKYRLDSSEKYILNSVRLFDKFAKLTVEQFTKKSPPKSQSLKTRSVN